LTADLMFAYFDLLDDLLSFPQNRIAEVKHKFATTVMQLG